MSSRPVSGLLVRGLGHVWLTRRAFAAEQEWWLRDEEAEVGVRVRARLGLGSGLGLGSNLRDEEEAEQRYQTTAELAPADTDTVLLSLEWQTLAGWPVTSLPVSRLLSFSPSASRPRALVPG